MTNLAQYALKLLGVTGNDRFPNDEGLALRPSPEEWEKGWTFIVKALTQYLLEESPTTYLQSELARCDRAFIDGDWMTFRQAVELIRATVQEGHQ